MRRLPPSFFWLSAVVMIAIVALGIAAENVDRFHSLPAEGTPQKWLRLSIGTERVWLNWHQSTLVIGGWVGQENCWGVRYERYFGGDWSISVRGWYFVLFGLIGAAALIRRAVQGPVVRPGICPRCGYDLRATPYRCPECGCEVFTELPLVD